MSGMLGYLAAEGRGTGDLIIAEVADRLCAMEVHLAGAVQVNVERDPTRKCDMDLHVLTGSDVVRISQRLGRHARGCRLDPEGLERAVGLVGAALQEEPALLIVNKFGKQEIDGRGFRPLIGEAIASGIPVLTAINPDNRDAFLSFAGDLAHPLPAETEAVVAWCLAQTTPRGRAAMPAG